MSTSPKLRVGDLARRYGVGDQNLHLFESHGLLNARSDELGPFYTAADEHRLKIILKGQRLGFSLQEIALMLAALATFTSATLIVHSQSLCRICLSAAETCLATASGVQI